MKCLYIGSFPPPHGGVTIKNNMLYNGLAKSINCEKVDLSKIKKFDILHIIKFLKAYLTNDNIFIIGASGVWRRRLSKFLYFINKKALSNSILVVMGGKSAEIIAKDRNYLKYVSIYKKIYVEANGMKKELEDKGLNNVDIFPNCRSIPNCCFKVNDTKSNRIKLVYFSQISEEKGADLVFDAAKLLDKNKVDYEIDFYGPVNERFKEMFFTNIGEFSNIRYCGIFKSDEEDVYEKLNQYDVLLFPSRWKHEGVPGILVESKIAGIPSIVSNINFNAEIINDGNDGIVMSKNNAGNLFNAVNELYSNRELLLQMKLNAKSDSINYSIEKYINNIMNNISIERD